MKFLESMPEPISLVEFMNSGNEFTLFKWLNSVQSSADFSPATKEAAYALSTWLQNADRICWPTLSQIWNRMGRANGNSDRVTTLLEPLVSSKWLEREKRPWPNQKNKAAFTYLYALTMPHIHDRGYRFLANENLYRPTPPLSNEGVLHKGSLDLAVTDNYACDANDSQFNIRKCHAPLK